MQFSVIDVSCTPAWFSARDSCLDNYDRTKLRDGEEGELEWEEVVKGEG